MTEEPISIKLQSTAQVQSSGQFEIMAITAGDGNGWTFTPEVLQASLALWDSAECFIDHDLWSRSIRDLAGICYNPQWDFQAQGVKLQLKPLGPAAPLLVELGRQMLSEDPKPDVGFSADVTVTAKGRKVESILKVHSIDLVFSPARGGAFLRALNSIYPERTLEQMTEPIAASTPQPVAPAAPGATLEEERQAIRALLDEQSRQAALVQEVEAVRQVRTEMYSYLLESALTASRLPIPMQAQLRKQFQGQVFDAVVLQTAIEDARQLVSDLTGSLVVQGPSRIHGMFSSEDQLQCAVDDMLGAPRDPDKASLKVAPLSGIRELYMMLTGDHDLHGGYFPDRVHLATTSDFTGLVKNALNKMVANRWEQLGAAGYDWWTKICTVEHFNSLNGITGTLVGTVGSLPVVAEGGEYTELAIGDSPETGTFYKYGGYIPLTLELIDRDETRKLSAYPRELAAAGLRKISYLVSYIFSQSSGAGPTMADGGALFNATAVTNAGGHANLLTGALTASTWDTVSAAIYNQPMLIKNATGYYGTGPKMAINPRYLLVPRALELTAKKILYPAWENTANIHSENQQQGAIGDVVVVPDWTDTNDWAAVCDPALAPAIFIGERFGIMPEVFIAGDNLSPAVFMNDEHRLKVRHFLAVWVNDFRPLANNHV